MKDDMKESGLADDLELTGEDNVDEPQIEEIEEETQSKVKKLQAKLKSCEAEKSEHLENLQRTKAEFLNSRKRLEEESARDKDRLINKHIEKLLPLCDSFQMAMSNTEVWNTVDQEWRKGVTSIHTQLQKILQSYDVTEIHPLGEEFDPNLHEAMSEQAVAEETKDHTVIEVIQNGYVRTINGKTELIRPARVSVGIYTN